MSSTLIRARSVRLILIAIFSGFIAAYFFKGGIPNVENMAAKNRNNRQVSSNSFRKHLHKTIDNKGKEDKNVALKFDDRKVRGPEKSETDKSNTGKDDNIVVGAGSYLIQNNSHRGKNSQLKNNDGYYLSDVIKKMYYDDDIDNEDIDINVDEVSEFDLDDNDDKGDEEWREIMSNVPEKDTRTIGRRNKLAKENLSMGDKHYDRGVIKDLERAEAGLPGGNDKTETATEEREILRFDRDDILSDTKDFGALRESVEVGDDITGSLSPNLLQLSHKKEVNSESVGVSEKARGEINRSDITKNGDLESLGRKDGHNTESLKSENLADDIKNNFEDKREAQESIAVDKFKELDEDIIKDKYVEPTDNASEVNSTQKFVESTSKAGEGTNIDTVTSHYTQNNNNMFKEVPGIHDEIISINKSLIQKEAKNVTKLIILAYMRTGSSYLGSLLEISPEIFFVYEPLHTVQKNFGPKKGQDGAGKVEIVNGQQIRKRVNAGIPTSYFHPNSPAVGVIKSVLSCQFHDLDRATLSQVMMDHSADTVGLRGCIVASYSDSASFKRCCEEINESCRSASVVGVKVIRLSMHQAWAMIKADPKVKVIHLIRDPRGMFMSQLWSRFYPEEFDNETITFCARIAQDIKDHAQLTREFPNRTLLIRYEDVIKSPVHAINQIYRFAGIEFSTMARKYAMSMSSDKERPYRWRGKISAAQATTVEANCAYVMRTMGYRTFPNTGVITNERFSILLSSFAEDWKGQVLRVEKNNLNI